MKIEVVGNELVIRMPINRPLKLSGSGKSLMVASSDGIVRTDCMVEGRPLSVGINAFVSNPDYVKPQKG